MQLCRDRTEYELGSRGLRVLSGRNLDDASAESNGTGKSALLMAALWCLTGRSDLRTLVGFSCTSPSWNTVRWLKKLGADLHIRLNN